MSYLRYILEIKKSLDKRTIQQYLWAVPIYMHDLNVHFMRYSRSVFMTGNTDIATLTE